MEYLLRLASFFCLFLCLEVNAGRTKCIVEGNALVCPYSLLSNVPDATEIKEIKGIEEIQEIKTLQLRGNPIKRLTEDSFTSWTHLTELNLRDCQLKWIDNEAFRPLTLLVKLNLGENLLTFNQGIYDSVFAPIGNLETLDMSRNPLGIVPNNAFSSLTRLEYLDLGYTKNGLKLNSNSFRGLKNLRRLYLYFNKLTTFPVGLNGSLNWDTLELDLTVNDIHCDCNVRWLNEMNLTSKTISGYCASPPSMQWKRIYTGMPEWYTCSTDMSSEEESTIRCYKYTDEHASIEDVKKEISAKLANPKSLGNGLFCFGDTDNKELLLEVSETLKWRK